MFNSFDQLREIVRGRWVARPASGALLRADHGAPRVVIDSRGDLAGSIFVAIRGERFDGHDYLEEARANGAVLAVVDHDYPESIGGGTMGVLRVPATRPALGDLARAHRRSLHTTRVVAITGSCGKTTTRRLIDAVLSTSLMGRTATRSFNNDIGVPLTLLSGRPADRYLLVEVGSSAPGEIDRLPKMIEPDLAVVTGVGRAHLEGLGSVESVAREKGSLLGRLRPGGAAIVHDDPRLDEFARGAWRFGSAPGSDLCLTEREVLPGGAGSAIEVNGRRHFRVGLPGRHNAMNALAAIAVGHRFGLDDAAINQGLKTIVPESMRLAPHEVDGIRFLNDAYNANPDSMEAGLQTFGELTEDVTRRVVVLGDMLELGDQATVLHEELGRSLAVLDEEHPLDLVVFVGEFGDQVRAGAGALAERIKLIDREDHAALKQVRNSLREGDAVYLKASRGIGLERIIEGPCSTTC